MPLNNVLSRIDNDLPFAITRLMRLLKIPSISTDPSFKKDCNSAADLLLADLHSLGATVEKHPTSGHPIIVGKIGDGGPHLLFYGHYDVQPVDPLNLWNCEPFDPQLQTTPSGRVIRGRGSSDDKGQLMTFIEACRAWQAVHGRLPCEITFFFEGEEESGSPSLVPFIEQNKGKLSADLALICDTGLFESRSPAIVTMLRGLLGEEFILNAANKDLHSGMFGGLATNPLRVLTRILSGLHDENGRITLPGFYDGVTALPDNVRTQWEALAFDHEGFLADVDLSTPAGEHGKTPLEMIWSEPTCEFNGVSGGYAGEGFKTVLPATASAKLSFRLVGKQDPFKIRATFRAYVYSMLPPDCSVRFIARGASEASVMATENSAFEAARQALSDEWSEPAAFVGCGGSIPIVGHFKKIIGMDALLIGFARDDDQIHSPNEKYDLESFHKGIRSWARILDAIVRRN